MNELEEEKERSKYEGERMSLPVWKPWICPWSQKQILTLHTNFLSETFALHFGVANIFPSKTTVSCTQ